MLITEINVPGFSWTHPVNTKLAESLLKSLPSDYSFTEDFDHSRTSQHKKLIDIQNRCPEKYLLSCRLIQVFMANQNDRICLAALHITEALTLAENLFLEALNKNVSSIDEYYVWKENLVHLIHTVGNRVGPALCALKMLKIDESGYFSEKFKRIDDLFFIATDTPTENLSWKADVSELRRIIVKFYMVEWLPFIAELKMRTTTDLNLFNKG